MEFSFASISAFDQQLFKFLMQNQTYIQILKLERSKQGRRRLRHRQVVLRNLGKLRRRPKKKKNLVPNLHFATASQELSDFSDSNFSNCDLKTSKMSHNSPDTNNHTPSEENEPITSKDRHQSSDNETDNYESDSSSSSETNGEKLNDSGNNESVPESHQETTASKNDSSSNRNVPSSRTDMNHSTDKNMVNVNTEPHAPSGTKNLSRSSKQIVKSKPESRRTECSAVENEKTSSKDRGKSRRIDRQHSSDNETAKNVSDSSLSSEPVRKSTKFRLSVDDSSDLASELDEEMLNQSKAVNENTRNQEAEEIGGHDKSNLKSEESKTNSSEIEGEQDDVSEVSSSQNAKKHPVLSKSSRRGTVLTSATPKIVLHSKSRKSNVNQAAKDRGVEGDGIIKTFQQEQELKHENNRERKESIETDSLRKIFKASTSEYTLGLATTTFIKNRPRKRSKKKRVGEPKESTPKAEEGIKTPKEKTISPSKFAGKIQISDVIELHPGSDVADRQDPQNETPRREEIFTRSRKRSSSFSTPEKVEKTPAGNKPEVCNNDTNQGQKMLEGENRRIKRNNSRKGKTSLFDSPDELGFITKPRVVIDGTHSKNVLLPPKLPELDVPRIEDVANQSTDRQTPSESVQCIPTHRISRNHKNDGGNSKTSPKFSTHGRPPSHSPSQTNIEVLKEIGVGDPVRSSSYDTSDSESDNVSQLSKGFPRVPNTSEKRNRKLSRNSEYRVYNFEERLTSDSSATDERRNTKRRRVKPSRSLSSRESPSPKIQRTGTERMFSKARNVPSNHINTLCLAPTLPHKDSLTKTVSRDLDNGAQSPLDYDYVPTDTINSQCMDSSNSESERFYRLVNGAGDDHNDGKQVGRRTEPPSRNRWTQGPSNSFNPSLELSHDSTCDSKRRNENVVHKQTSPEFLPAADDHVVDWDSPTYFDGEDSHGVLYNIEPDIAFEKAVAWSNSLRKFMVLAPISILKKKSQIESSVKNAARQVRTFDAISTTSAMTLTRSTVQIIKNFICPNFWEGEPCDKSCGKKHKINCDEFPSVSTDEVFRAVSDRLIEMEHPSIEMTCSFLEWLSGHNENIRMLSFSKILFTTNKGFNSLTQICGLLVKYLARSYNCEHYRMVEFLLKFHYVMMKKNPEVAKTVVNKLIGYSQVGTYRHKVYEIVRFLLDVDGFSLQFKILDKLLYEVNTNPPLDILIAKENIKRQLKSYEKAEDPDFRARAYRFLLTYYPETTRPPNNQ